MEAFVERAIADNEEQPQGPDSMVLIAVTNEHLAGAVVLFRPLQTGDKKMHSVRFERKLDGLKIVPIETRLSFEEIVALADQLIEKTEQGRAKETFEELRVYRSSGGNSKNFKLNFPQQKGLFENVLDEFLFPETKKNE